MLPKKCIFNRNKLTALIVVFGALSASTPVQACGYEPYIGEVCTFTFDYCPEGYLEANGQELVIAQNQALFSLLGTRFGGNGSTTFMLPDLQGRTPIGKGVPAGQTANVYQLGQSYGAVSTQLTTTQLPAHTHTAALTQTITASLPVSTLVGSSTGTLSALANGQTGYLAGISGKAGVATATLTGPYTTTAPVAGSMATLPVTVNASGGAVSVYSTPIPTAKVPTLTPSVAMTICIATQGLYPVRP